MNTIDRLYWWLKRIIAPDLRYCQEEFEDTLTAAIQPQSRWLDLGCGHSVLPPWRSDAERQLTARPRQVVGLDRDMSSLRRHETISALVRGDISRLPFRDESFSLVTCNMVFEHLEQPEAQLREIRRVLAPGGELVFLTPNTVGYTTLLARLIPEFLKDSIIRFIEGRESHHVFPTFYRINSPRQIEQSVRESGLVPKEIRLIPSAAQLRKVPPLLVLELLWIRLTMIEAFKGLRTNMIVRCARPRSEPGR